MVAAVIELVIKVAYEDEIDVDVFCVKNYDSSHMV